MGAKAFSGIWLTAEPETLRSRISGRAKGASDATPGILDAQLRTDPGIITWSTVSSEGSLDETVDAILETVSADPRDHAG